MAKRKLGALLATILLHFCLSQITPENMPEFLEPLENYTIIQGRDVSFTCVVNHLQSYKVAWIKSDSRAILAIHTHLVAHNARLSVTHNGHNTWKLHISNVQKNDSGTYMCQVNTEPMLSQTGYMTVVIPPDIIDDSSDGLVAHEGGNIKLRCIATGSPEPNVTWKREDGRNIVLREHGQKRLLAKYESETLELSGVLRQEMGTYLCIASSGIPPSVSKRYSVQVQFQPSIKVTNHVVAAPVNKDVTLQCSVEASPQALNTWFTDKGHKLLSSEKYLMTERQTNDYSWEMNLTIRSLIKTDFVGYICSSENALGKAEGAVRLQELRDFFQTTIPSIQSRPNDLRPGHKKPSLTLPKTRQKEQRQHIANELEIPNPYNVLQEVSQDIKGNKNQDNSINDGRSTQAVGGQVTRGHPRTERPQLLPSVSPPWIRVNGTCGRTPLVSLLLICTFVIFTRRYCQ